MNFKAFMESKDEFYFTAMLDKYLEKDNITGWFWEVLEELKQKLTHKEQSSKDQPPGMLKQYRYLPNDPIITINGLLHEYPKDVKSYINKWNKCIEFLKYVNFILEDEKDEKNSPINSTQETIDFVKKINVIIDNNIKPYIEDYIIRKKKEI